MMIICGYNIDIGCIERSVYVLVYCVYIWVDMYGNYSVYSVYFCVYFVYDY